MEPPQWAGPSDASSIGGLSRIGTATGYDAAASGTGRPAPPAGAAGHDDIRSLIAVKERELHDVLEYRMATLEATMGEKDRENAELRGKLLRMKEDFTYNLKLFEERDAELERYEAQVEAMTAQAKAR